MTDLEKERACYDYINANTMYDGKTYTELYKGDDANRDNINFMSFKSYGVIIDGLGVYFNLTDDEMEDHGRRTWNKNEFPVCNGAIY